MPEDGDFGENGDIGDNIKSPNSPSYDGSI